MIFASLFLLVVSAVLFAIGVSKSSIGYLVTALAAAAGACLLLLGGYTAHRRRQEAEAGAAGAGGSLPAPGNGHIQQPVYLVPIAPGQSFVMPSVGGPASTAGLGGEPFIGYDTMTAAQIVTLLRSGALTAEQLSAIAIYETGHQARKTILDAVSTKA